MSRELEEHRLERACAPLQHADRDAGTAKRDDERIERLDAGRYFESAVSGARDPDARTMEGEIEGGGVVAGAQYVNFGGCALPQFVNGAVEDDSSAVDDRQHRAQLFDFRHVVAAPHHRGALV